MTATPPILFVVQVSAVLLLLFLVVPLLKLLGGEGGGGHPVGENVCVSGPAEGQWTQRQGKQVKGDLFVGWLLNIPAAC